ANGLTGYNPRAVFRPLGTVPWSEIGEFRATFALSGGDSEGLFSYARLRIEFGGALKGRILIVGVDQLPAGISAELYLSVTEITQLIAEIERVRPAAA
ncbi:MAG: hypothetical protein ABJA94_11605, partial [Rhodoglobus sp.]